MSKENAQPNFKKRIFRAGAWSIGGQAIGQLLRLIGNLIMTRLLVPELFGIMAIVQVVLAGLVQFSDIGLRLNIIQSKRGDDPIFLNSVWSVQIVRGVVIWLVGLLICLGFHYVGLLGKFSEGTVYADPVLPIVIAVVTFITVIEGFDSTKIATATRELALHRYVTLEVLCSLAGIIVMVTWAMFDKSIWALVAGAYAGATIRAVMSHTYLPGAANRWHWDKHAVSEIIHFGKWIFLSSILGFLLMNSDRLLLGGLISAADLGLYSIAFVLINVITTVFAELSGKVVFPAISETYRNSPVELKRVYYKFRIYIDMAMLFLAGIMLIVGQDVIDILYDPRYAKAGKMLEAFSLLLVAQRYVVTDQVFLAIGKPSILSWEHMVRIVGIFTLLPAGYALYGLNGAIFGLVGAYLMGLIVTFYFKSKIGLFDLRLELVVLPVYLLGCLAGELLGMLIHALELF